MAVLYLWRAVGQDGNVLDILVQNRRGKAAAHREVMPCPASNTDSPST